MRNAFVFNIEPRDENLGGLSALESLDVTVVCRADLTKDMEGLDLIGHGKAENANPVRDYRWREVQAKEGKQGDRLEPEAIREDGCGRGRTARCPALFSPLLALTLLAAFSTNRCRSKFART